MIMRRLAYSFWALMSVASTVRAIATEDLEPNPPLHPLRAVSPGSNIRTSNASPPTEKLSFLSSTLGSNMVLQRDQGRLE